MPVRHQLWGRWRSFPGQNAARLTPSELSLVEALRRLCAAGSGPSFWFLPTQTWFCSGFQRPQQMARALAETGCPVVFSEPWHCNAVWLTAATRKEREFEGLRQLAENLWLLRCPQERIRPFLEAAPPGAVVMSWPYQDCFARGLTGSLVIYEMIDDHSLFPEADDHWRAAHRHWVQHAAVVAASADDLLAQLRQARPDTLLLPNGVRWEDWSEQPPVNCPADLLKARRSPLVVGYYGAIADWFDWNMWETAARLRPNWAFVLIGYPYDGNAEKLRSRLQSLPNAHYLGPKTYHELPAYLARIDVATIPFVLNTITHGCSPVKLFEYMAAGKPIVCSPMREILKYRGIYFARSGPEFVEKIETAFARRNEVEYQRLLQEQARANTWKTRALRLRAAVESAIAQGARA